MESSNSCRGKNSWPELVGVKGNEAVATVERENPYVEAVVVKEGTGVTKDYLCDRVRVWVDNHAIVTRIPTIG